MQKRAMTLMVLATLLCGTVTALAAQGVRIPPELVPNPETEGMAIGRPHIARALIAMGLANTMEQAFGRYLGEGRPAYEMVEAIRLDYSLISHDVQVIALTRAITPPMRHQSISERVSR